MTKLIVIAGLIWTLGAALNTTELPSGNIYNSHTATALAIN